jgi:hypothetical protein
MEMEMEMEMDMDMAADICRNNLNDIREKSKITISSVKI